MNNPYRCYFCGVPVPLAAENADPSTLLCDICKPSGSVRRAINEFECAANNFGMNPEREKYFSLQNQRRAELIELIARVAHESFQAGKEAAIITMTEWVDPVSAEAIKRAIRGTQ